MAFGKVEGLTEGEIWELTKHFFDEWGKHWAGNVSVDELVVVIPKIYWVIRKTSERNVSEGSRREP